MDLIEAADRAMYQAKDSGRDRVMFDPSVLKLRVVRNGWQPRARPRAKPRAEPRAGPSASDANAASQTVSKN